MLIPPDLQVFQCWEPETNKERSVNMCFAIMSVAMYGDSNPVSLVCGMFKEGFAIPILQWISTAE